MARLVTRLSVENALGTVHKLLAADQPRKKEEESSASTAASSMAFRSTT